MLETYIMPVALVTVIGILSGLILAIASKVMYVHVDETVATLREALPGANCGACGFAGCDEYAKQLAADRTLKTTLCPPGGAEVAAVLSEILGVVCEEMKPMVAVVTCSGDCEHTTYKMDYKGIPTCKACNEFYRGRTSCRNACLGFGDCAVVCPYDAIHMEKGLAVIDRTKCIGCGVCQSQCPNDLITIVPETSCVFVGCNSPEKGAMTRKICSAGCIGCKKCEKVCQHGAITVENNLAKIDPEKCTNCGECIDSCPTNVINRYRQA